MNWVHLSDTTPRASKEHQCELCGLRIRKGAKHVARRGIDREYGGYVTVRMHAVCEAKTRGWNELDWECRDTRDFRQYVLGLPLLGLEEG